MIKITASCELPFKEIELWVASCMLKNSKSQVASCKMHFKKLKVRVANGKYELKICASCKLKVPGENWKCELGIKNASYLFKMNELDDLVYIST